MCFLDNSYHTLNWPGIVFNTRYIVIEGPIGVGKTSLAIRLAESLNCESVLEQPNENPFLERFYRSRKQYALPTQLFFLFQRVRQLHDLKQSDLFNQVRISDFMLDKDALFAQVTLDDDEYRLYQQVYSQFSLDIPMPDLVIYLQAPVNVLMERIRRRGIDYERMIAKDYLQNLVDAYTTFFHRYAGSPLLIINSARINIVDRQEDYEMLLSYIKSIKSGRHYFNPLSAP